MSDDVIVNAETELYRDMWGIDAYAEMSPGELLAPIFDALVKERCVGRGTVLDAGCGAGKGAFALQQLGYDVTLCDLTDEGLTAGPYATLPLISRPPFLQAALWDDLRQLHHSFYDWVYCTDVLEHLPTQFVALALTRLLQVTRRGLFLSVSFCPDVMGVWVGRPLHLTVQSFTWWRDLLRSLGSVVDARDLISSGIFFVEPR